MLLAVGLLLIVLSILLVKLTILKVLFPGNIVGLGGQLVVVLDLVGNVSVSIYSCLYSCVCEGIRRYQTTSFRGALLVLIEGDCLGVG